MEQREDRGYKKYAASAFSPDPLSASINERLKRILLHQAPDKQGKTCPKQRPAERYNNASQTIEVISDRDQKQGSGKRGRQKYYDGLEKIVRSPSLVAGSFALGDLRHDNKTQRDTGGNSSGEPILAEENRGHPLRNEHTANYKRDL